MCEERGYQERTDDGRTGEGEPHYGKEQARKWAEKSRSGTYLCQTINFTKESPTCLPWIKSTLFTKPSSLLKSNKNTIEKGSQIKIRSIKKSKQNFF